MGWFSTYVSDPPGNADQIAGIKDGLSAAAEKANSAEKDLSSIKSSISRWAGQARDNYSESSQRAARRLYNFGAGLTSASSDVDKYYWKLRSIKSYVDGTLRPALENLDKQFDATPMADRWSKFWELRKQALSIQDDYNSKYKELKQSAEELTQSLKGALAIEPVARDSKNVGTPQDPSRTERLSPDKTKNIDDERKQLAAGTYDPRNVRQGGIGDCYYLASLMAVMNSSDGQKRLAQGIRPHYDSAGNIDGYYVRVYRNPGIFSGPSQEVLVRDTYENGASSSGHTGVISLYEKAYAQTFPDGVNNSIAFGFGGISGGHPQDALPDITGKGTHTVDGAGGIFGWGEGYDQSERQDIINSVNSGRPTVASTASSKNFTSKTAPVTATLPDGTQETIKIYDSHSYMVKKADQSGVTLVNPHGSNPRATGGSVDGGEFTISWEDFQKYYGDVAIGSL
ncbi:C2 family cysteine protease [Actinomyces sp.]